MLAGMGGLMGVTIAWLVAVAVRSFTPVPMEVPLNAVVLGVDAFGRGRPVLRNLSRARRAARLDPIVALRSETS